MSDVLFYHLLSTPLEAVLPDLLEKSLAKGWTAVVQTGHAARLEVLNNALWTYKEESFLPHGSSVDGEGADQPIWLTDGTDNPNGAAIRFLLDGAEIDNADPYERVVYLFNGNDQDQLTHARGRWKVEKAAGHAVTYWAQNEYGKWEKKA